MEKMRAGNAVRANARPRLGWACECMASRCSGILTAIITLRKAAYLRQLDRLRIQLLILNGSDVSNKGPHPTLSSLGYAANFGRRYLFCAVSSTSNELDFSILDV